MDKLKQYCRYCNWLVTGNGTYCEEHKKEVSDSYATHVNHCKDFLFNEMDAYALTNGYKPRNRKQKRKDERKIKRMKLF